MYWKTFLNSAPRLGYFQEPKETHLELASFDSALPGDFPFTCFNWYRNSPSKAHQDNNELWKLRKRGGLFWPIAREKTERENIMDLLNLCLTSTYFQYNGKHYKQLHGTAMGSPVSVVVAEIVMQNIEEQALARYKRHKELFAEGNR